MKNLILYLFTIISLLACGSDDESDSDILSSDDDVLTILEEKTIKEILDTHNSYRSDVGISNLIWSEEVAISAQSWADQLSKNCDFKHSSSAYGENIWAGTTGAFDPTRVVTSWGSEIANYNYESNTCDDGEVCGHYTQIVWKNTTKVGCGTATCDGLDIWVCQYDPPGNFIGQKPY